MESRYRVTISNRNLYKEIELTPDIRELTVGTDAECDVRLRKGMFFDRIALKFISNNGDWTLVCSENLYLTQGDVRKQMSRTLVHGDELTVKYQQSDSDVFALSFVIDFDSDRKLYERQIDISGRKSISIGRDKSCDLILTSNWVKNDRVDLVPQGDSLTASVLRSTYGLYRNGQKVNGMAYIRNGDFFTVSDYSFYYKDNTIYTEIRDDMVSESLLFSDRPQKENYPKFSRNTRTKITVCEDKIEVLDPPAIPQKPKNNLLMRLLPSMGMLMASMVMALMGGSMIIFSAISGGMAIVTSIMGVIQSKKDFKKNSSDRIEKYNKYIAEKREEIERIRKEELETLEKIYISPEEELARLRSFSDDLFDRAPDDSDFLAVRLGTGNVKAKRIISYKKQERLEIEDDLQRCPENLYREYMYIPDAPIICDFKVSSAIGIIGDEKYRYEIMKNIVLDICARQYYTDVRLYFIASDEDKGKVDWLKYLPYVSSLSGGTRNIVSDPESKNLVFENLYKELTIREQKKSFGERIVVFLYDEYGFKNHPVSKFVDKAQDLGVTFVFFAKEKGEISLGCRYLVQIRDEHTAELMDTDDAQNVTEFAYPSIPDDDALEMVRILAPVYTEEISLEGTLTKNITLFELLNIIAADDLDLAKRWSGSQVFKSMSAPIGVSKTGTVYLDLHDKAHGPHGLVAGTTGSGKSELLQTYILSIATLFNPCEVAFLVIDFKGGGMANQFKDLPHMLGAITNIDGREIDRSLKSIKAELQKRQLLFAEADVNHIDKYIKKFKSGEVSTPLPHLIIIVDEFAELKAEQPDFMKELISAARIGRSLGVHLILATQKPSGQVNEQIWSNSRFKLCLKVQSQEDSNEVLKSPLAAEIKEPGRAYLQVGNNEIFELFQSAYSGAPEKTDNSNIKEFSIYGISDSGKRYPVYVQKKQKSEGSRQSQLDAIVEYVADYCRSNKIEKLPNICLAPLEERITVPDDLGKYDLEALPLGIYDDPDSQQQGCGCFDLCSENTLIIGSSQTGKTNLLQTIIRVSAEKFSPREIVFYIVDFGAMYLKNFEKLGHVGGVVTVSEEEKLKNLFKLLTEEITARKTRFLEMGLSSFAAYKDAGNADLPQIVFMIDNFSVFKELYEDSYGDVFSFLTREGIACGISVVVTNAQSSGIGYRLMSNFANKMALKCNDTNEYISLFDRCRMQPADIPGRLLFKKNKEVYEMQSFLAFEGEKEIDRSNSIREFISLCGTRYPDMAARMIPSIPDVLTYEYLAANYTIPQRKYQYFGALDYATVDPVVFNFRTMGELCIIGKDPAKRAFALNSIISNIRRNIFSSAVKLFIIDNVERPLKALDGSGYVEEYTADYSYIGTLLDDLQPELEDRYKALMDGGSSAIESRPLIMIVVNNYDAIGYISESKNLFAAYVNTLKRYKTVGVMFLFSDVEDAAVNYNSPELLKRQKESKKAIVVSNLKDFKFCDIPSSVVRNSKPLGHGDAYYLNDTEVSRIKLAEEEQKNV